MIEENLLEELDKKIKDIHDSILEGKISLLDLELVPMFNQIRDTLNIDNLDTESLIYKNTCEILNQKFDELKKLLSSLDTQEKFTQYMNSEPSDAEIYDLFEGCWSKVFTLDALSMDFLEISKERLSKLIKKSYSIEHLQKTDEGGDFILEVPKLKFSEKMMEFFNTIQDKLPCSFEVIFEDESDQIEIFEKFVFLLHLLQIGIIKYQKETNTLYK